MQRNKLLISWQRNQRQMLRQGRTSSLKPMAPKAGVTTHKSRYGGGGKLK